MSSTEHEETPVDYQKPVVWLVNEGGHNYDSALEFGRILPLTRASVNPFALDRMALVIGQKLVHAKSEDYILVSGLALVNALVLAMWFTKFEKANILQWSTHKGKYVRLVLHLSTLNKATRIILPVD